MNRRLSLLAITVVLASGSGAAHPPAPMAIQELRTVYITVMDKDGLPVDDLTAQDFEVKEGGRPVEVTEVGVATDPMQIALIVDDNGTGLFRSALAQFVRRLDGRAVMALSCVTGQTMKVVDYTPSVDAILRGVATLNARPGTPDGGQLLEGISEAAIELRRREAQRPVIIALTVGGEEHSTIHSDMVLDQLRKSGTLLHVFSVERSALRSTMVAGRPKDLLQENMHLNRVLGDGPKQSGGRHQSIVASAGFIASLQTLASELTSQYRLTYALPAGAKRTERLNVTVRRKGLQVRAPSKIPT
jgi:VWFA-related protein